MKKRKSYGAPSHISKIVFGHDKPTGGRVTKAELEQIVDMATFHASQAATLSRGSGRWRDPTDGRMYKEKSTIVEVVGPAAQSCDRFHKRMKSIGARAAQIAKQRGVLVETACDGGRIEADVVTPSGKSLGPMTLLRKAGTMTYPALGRLRKRKRR